VENSGTTTLTGVEARLILPPGLSDLQRSGGGGSGGSV